MFILGNVLIFMWISYEPINDKMLMLDCDMTVFKFAFWTTTHHIVLFISLLIIGCPLPLVWGVCHYDNHQNNPDIVAGTMDA